MEAERQIIKALENGDKVQLTSIGTLNYKISHAEIDAKNDSFLPPRKVLEFTAERNLNVENQFSDFARILVARLILGEKVSLGELGKFTNLEGNYVFEPAEIDQNFYGLETVNFKPSAKVSPKGKRSTFSRFILWFFLIIIPIAAIVYFGITYQDQIQKAFPQLFKSEKTMNKTPVQNKKAAKIPINKNPSQEERAI